MSDETQRSLHEVLGSVLKGFIRAQETASFALISFIERVGFIPDNKFSIHHSETGGLADISVGMMRMVHFRYVSQRGDGKEELISMSVPLLSLISIPAMRVRRASTEFLLEFGSIVDSPKPSSAPLVDRKEGHAMEDDDSIGAVFSTVGKDMGVSPLDITVRLPALVRDKSGRGMGDGGLLPGLMRVQMDIEASDFPAGIQKLLHVSGISSVSKFDVEPDGDGADVPATDSKQK
jgi:hypothetical protein